MAKLQLNNNIDDYTHELEQNINDLNVIQNNLNSLIYTQTDKLLQIEDHTVNQISVYIDIIKKESLVY